MLISIDPGSPVPLFEQLVAGLRSQVISGAVSAGERLPAARELGASLDVNVHTVLRAYQVLRDEGFIHLRPGRGAVVADRARDYQKLSQDVARVVAEAQKLELTQGALGALIREAWN